MYVCLKTFLEFTSIFYRVFFFGLPLSVSHAKRPEHTQRVVEEDPRTDTERCKWEASLIIVVCCCTLQCSRIYCALCMYANKHLCVSLSLHAQYINSKQDILLSVVQGYRLPFYCATSYEYLTYSSLTLLYLHYIHIVLP